MARIAVAAKGLADFYPANNGIQASSATKYLMLGELLDEFGSIGRYYLASLGTPFKMRALPVV